MAATRTLMHTGIHTLTHTHTQKCWAHIKANKHHHTILEGEGVAQVRDGRAQHNVGVDVDASIGVHDQESVCVRACAYVCFLRVCVYVCVCVCGGQ